MDLGDIKSVVNNLSPQLMDGYVFTIKQIEKKHFSCKDCINHSLHKEEQQYDCYRVPFDIIKWQFDAIEVVVNIIATNESDGGWRVDSRDVRLVDENGLVYEGFFLCDEHEKNMHRSKEHEYISKRTQADMVYCFNNFPSGKKIREVLVINGKDTLHFTLCDPKLEKDIFSVENYRDNTPIKEKGNYIPNPTSERNDSDSEKGAYEDGGLSWGSTYSLGPSYQFRNLQDNVNQLKILIFQRLQTHLTSSEVQKLEDKIETRIFSLNLSFDTLSIKEKTEYSTLYDSFQEEVINYRAVLYQKKISEANYSRQLQKVSELLNIEPYEFEHICSNLMRQMGYEKVLVTPRSNDKGIDIVGEKNGIKAVAQCKRYRNTVGSPDMQLFIGAMHNANAEEGIYFTTGAFTREAEVMAKSNNIILIDRTELSKLLSLFDDLNTMEEQQSTLWEDDLPE